MSSRLSSRRLLTESVPMAAVLLFWLVVSWFAAGPPVSDGVRYAGIVMALLYAVIRGVTLGRAPSLVVSLDDIGGFLRANVTVLLAAGAWFLAARVLLFTGQLWRSFGLPGVFRTPTDGLGFVFVTTGVLTVVLYAIAVGLPAIQGGDADNASDIPDAAPADD